MVVDNALDNLTVIFIRNVRGREHKFELTMRCHMHMDIVDRVYERDA